MVPLKSIVSCSLALLFASTLYAEEKSSAQGATTQVATATKTQAAPEVKTAAAKKDGDARSAPGLMKMDYMHGAMCSKMVAAGNGGVIILMGNRLLKYDANLTLVKETEIKPAAEPEKKAVKPMAPEVKPADTKK
ncbi:MAG: hypothetical protein JXA71_20315 [Chitinispirillaceae bacterium]|nr:hypothetical protein [Chitinispirillaceae bacterium]